jgi:hypothetical protein
MLLNLVIGVDVAFRNLTVAKKQLIDGCVKGIGDAFRDIQRGRPRTSFDLCVESTGNASALRYLGLRQLTPSLDEIVPGRHLFTSSRVAFRYL